jgi:hypothetical protein
MVLLSKHPYYKARLSKVPSVVYYTPGFVSSSKFHSLYLPLEKGKPRKEWEIENKKDGLEEKKDPCRGEECDVNYLIGSGIKKNKNSVSNEPEPASTSQDFKFQEGHVDQKSIDEILKHPRKISAAEFKNLPKLEEDEEEQAAEELNNANAAASQKNKTKKIVKKPRVQD